MKTKSLSCFLLLGVIIALYGCGTGGIKIIPGQDYITRDYHVDRFHMIDFRGVGNVVYHQSDTQKVEIYGPDNIVPLYNVKVVNGRLIVDMEKKYKPNKTGNLEIRISSPELACIDNSGVGNVNIPETVRTEELSLYNSGVGNFNAENLECNKIVARFSGVGNVYLKGKCVLADFRVSSVGNCDAGNLIAENVVMNVSGVGNASCYASGSIKLECSGVGKIEYGGNPSQKSISKSGVGKISAR